MSDDSPTTGGAAVTPSDTTNLITAAANFNAPRKLYIGVSGDVAITMSDGTGPLVFKSVPVGVLNVRPQKVMATGTTATNILALY